MDSPSVNSTSEPAQHCPTRQEWNDFQMGRLCSGTLQRFADHLEDCGECGDILRDLQNVEDAMLSTLKQVTVPATAELPDLESLKVRIRKLIPTDAPLPALTWDGGRRVGPFELQEVAGSGSFGVVYRAVDTRVSREVALKLLRPELAMDAQHKRRFLSEASLSARMQHPALVTVYEAGEVDDTLYIASAYCDGPTLATWIREQKPLTAHDAARVVARLATAIADLHRQGVIHRDIKPTNILLEPVDEQGILTSGSEDQYLPKLTDFGLAKPMPVDAPQETGETKSWAILGTPEYLAPEVILHGSKRADTRADIYALGVLLYELLVGRPPFRGRTPLQTLRQIESAEVEPPRNVKPSIPRQLDTICQKCLSKSPSERYARAEYLAEDLERYLSGEPISARRPGLLTRVFRWARKNPAWAALTCLIVVAALGIIVGLGEHNRQLASALHRADQSERRTSAHLYAASVRLASEAWGQRDVTECRNFLDRCLPPNGMVDRDLRGIEWYLLAGSLPLQQSEVLEAHESGVTCVVFAPNGQSFATSGLDGTVKIWSVENHRLEQTLLAHDHDVNRIAYSPDGRRLISGGDDGWVRVWDASTAKLLLEKEYGPRVFEVAFSQNGRYAIAAGDGNTIELWDEQGKSYASFPSAKVRGLAVSSTSALIATTEDDFKLAIWDVHQRKHVLTTGQRHLLEIDQIVFDPGGGAIATASRDRTARLWDAATGDVISQFDGHLDGVHGVAFSQTRPLLATASRDQTVRLWDYSGQTLAVFRGHKDTVWSMAFANDSDTLATGSRDGTVRFWSTDSLLAPAYRQLAAESKYARAQFADLSSDGQTLAVQIDTNCIALMDTASLKTRTEIQTPDNDFPLFCISMSADGKFLAAGSEDGVIHAWDCSTGKQLARFQAHERPVLALAFAPDTNQLATTSDDFRVRLWDFVQGELEHDLGFHDDLVKAIEYSPDGQWLATCGDDRSVVVWNRKTTDVEHILTGHRNSTSCIAFSPDSRQLASGGHDGRIKRWNLELGTEIDTLVGATHQVNCLSYAGDGRTLISGGLDRTLRFWHVATGEQLIEFAEPKLGEICGLSVSAESNRFVSCERDSLGNGTAVLWSANPKGDGSSKQLAPTSSGR